MPCSPASPGSSASKAYPIHSHGQIMSIHLTSAAGTWSQPPSLLPNWPPNWSLTLSQVHFLIHRQNDHSKIKKHVIFPTSHNLAPSDFLACHRPSHSLCASLVLLFLTHINLVLPQGLYTRCSLSQKAHPLSLQA